MEKPGQKWWSVPLVVCWLLVSAAMGIAAERSVVVLPLKHIVPDQVLPPVQAILPEGATATSYNNQLILRVSKEELSTVESLLQQIDKASQQLLISVRTPKKQGTANDGISVNGTFSDGRVQIGDSSQPGRVIIRSDNASTKQNGLQSVRATEGLPAYITVGTSKPITTYRTDSLGNRQSVTEYKAADQGFYVTARIIGDSVQLNIKQTDDEHENRSINTRHLSTTVSGKLGEWITIGGSGVNSSNNNSGLVVRSSSSKNSSSSVQLKVEAIGE
ncbi:hypothetical protein [Parendozoicomonas sp. Alg238-R29]|uniref:hypothetical protein n=1 Tax=Parendozoicomonas sp. Alg238-R29 TaxID=2993446 RepID=UPI00248DB16B|nr:hypothetical protein [Parendozoicomonas sp. Alg238-R29]